MADPQADPIKSPIIMKVDAPESTEDEDNDKSEVKLDTSKVCSPLQARPVLASPRFTSTNPFALKANPLTPSKLGGNKGVLRPSQLGQATKSFSLTPSKFVSNGETVPKFLPLVTNETKKELSTSAQLVQNNPQQSFVFGQNLQERVLGSEEPKPSTSLSNSNGTSEMLFSSAAKESPVVTSSKSLVESAREYEEQRANKRKYEEVEVKTGEEDEQNILHLSCKLFAFDKGIGNWQERGRGTLRLNDLQSEDADDANGVQSRLVFRTSGVLRVILNTKIWAEMTVEHASQKSVRFTAADVSTGEIRVYLVMAGPDDIKHLYNCLVERRDRQRARQSIKRSNVSSPTSTTAEN